MQLKEFAEPPIKFTLPFRGKEINLAFKLFTQADRLLIYQGLGAEKAEQFFKNIGVFLTKGMEEEMEAIVLIFSLQLTPDAKREIFNKIPSKIDIDDEGQEIELFTTLQEKLFFLITENDGKDFIKVYAEILEAYLLSHKASLALAKDIKKKILDVVKIV